MTVIVSLRFRPAAAELRGLLSFSWTYSDHGIETEPARTRSRGIPAC